MNVLGIIGVLVLCRFILKSEKYDVLLQKHEEQAGMTIPLHFPVFLQSMELYIPPRIQSSIFFMQYTLVTT